MNGILLCLLFVAAALVPARHALHIFQQNSYIVKRYLTWLKENGLRTLKESLVFILFAAACSAVRSSDAAVWGLFVLAAAGIVREKYRTYRKPLVLTARVKRQCAVMGVLAALMFLAVYRMNAVRILPVLSLFLPWLLIIPVGWITAPIEHAVQQSFLNDAKRILAERPDLIRIGITGSYGKTSTKNVIQAVVSEKYSSLMTPASFNTPMGITRTIREQLKPIHQVFVCEMGADKPGDISELMAFVHPVIGVVTSVGPQHLATFGSQEKITYEKMRMVEELPEGGTAVLNYDNELIRTWQVKNSVKIITYGIRSEDADYRAEDIRYDAEGSSFTVVHGDERIALKTKLLGELNILNILSAVAVARELDVPWFSVERAVRQMKQVEHRLELTRIGGLRFIDDAFNANPSGAKMALDVLERMPGKRWIVTPGMIELGERQAEINHTFGTQMPGHCDEVILVGREQTEPILRGLRDSGFPETHIMVADGLQEAMNRIFAEASPDDTILLENDLPDAFNH